MGKKTKCFGGRRTRTHIVVVVVVVIVIITPPVFVPPMISVMPPRELAVLVAQVVDVRRRGSHRLDGRGDLEGLLGL